MDDLVKRLRAIHKNYDLARGIHCDIREAADRIEALEAQVRAADALAALFDRFGMPEDSEVGRALAAYRATKEGGA